LNPIISGIGVTASIGQGKTAFTEALFSGSHKFDSLKRPGRQNGAEFIGAEIGEIDYPELITRRMLRSTSLSGQISLLTLYEAWNEAKLDSVNPKRIGLIIGGSNFQQREQLQIFQKYGNNPEMMRPTYALNYMDTDLCGLCTELYGIKGFAYTLGGASASGSLAIVKAVEAVKSGQVDICIAIGTLMDISYMECHAFRALGAMGSDRFAGQPDQACRPFDKLHDGFIYGESCGAVVIESPESAKQRNIIPYASINGAAVIMDGNRNPNPSYEGEVGVIKKVLEQANLSAADIDYVNPHGTGSVIGDETELNAIIDCKLTNAYLNATKSVLGHGLSAAGNVEVIATLLQMRESKLHPTLNLNDPIRHEIKWIGKDYINHEIKNAIKLSMGFGGINTALCLQKI
jgi:malonyl-ACP decarboxylase